MLQLQVIDATVAIRHEERNDIIVYANNPDNWKVTGGEVLQTKVQTGGSTNTFNGDIYIGGNVNVRGGTFIGGSIKASGRGAVAVGPGSIAVGRAGIVVGGSNRGKIIAGDCTVINSGGRHVRMEGNDVWIDGKKVTGVSDDSDDSGKDESATPEPDRLELVVPLSFRGGLQLTNSGSRDVSVDCWQGGDISVTLNGSGDFKAGNLQELAAATLRCTGSGDIKINLLNGNSVQASMAGSGDLEITKLAGQSFQASMSGSGDLDVDELEVDILTLRQSGSGDATIHSGAASAGSINNSGSGDTNMRGRFGTITKRSSGTGDITVRVRN